MRQATRDLFAYFRELLAARRAEPRDDLVSAMIQAEADTGQVDENDLPALCTLLLAAGHETTSSLIGNAVVALQRHPEQRKRLIEDPALMPTAVEEFLRFDSPVVLTDRAVTEDVEIGGQRFRRGKMVGVLLASANRDADQFKEPDSLDVGRDPNPHLALSHGNHFCLGAQLARMEGEIALGALLRRFPDFRASVDDIEWRRSTVLRGPRTLPVRL
jgi:cytochrome P450